MEQFFWKKRLRILYIPFIANLQWLGNADQTRLVRGWRTLLFLFDSNLGDDSLVGLFGEGAESSNEYVHQKYAEVSRPHITFTSPTPSYSYTGGAPFSALSNIFYMLLSVLCVNETCMMQVLVNKDDRKGKEFSDFSISRRKRLLLKKTGFKKIFSYSLQNICCSWNSKELED